MATDGGLSRLDADAVPTDPVSTFDPDLPSGDYTFEVEAVDRHLVRSSSHATTNLEIRPSYERIAWMSALGLALALVGLQGTRIVRRDRRLAAANDEPADRVDEREARNLAHIETSSGNLLNLINDILDRSQIEADPDRLRQVVMNLLGNAAKFTDEGSITLSLRRDGDGAVRLAVADTGIGIPPADLPHLFDEFHRVERQGGAQSDGTGLGPAIPRKTVELLGDTISAHSAVGAGTTVTLRIAEYGTKA